ncbi:TIGR02757 family protein [Campylobacter cuniculorum]|uniref:TIGR02757 family protein n=1 Tax=Campylobacter cuniculorum TaxID=374106 RepID=UPI0023F1ED2F|nr:TIGR02757 family protein [Campylobacter cuniculorum]
MEAKRLLSKAEFKAQFENLVRQQNNSQALFNAPDPLQIAKKYKEEWIALLCALFSYGHAKNILNFLKKLDFSLLDFNEECIQKECKNLKYRFQNSKDIAQIFITLRRLKQEDSLENLFTQAYQQDKNILNAIKTFIKKARQINVYESYGYNFFFLKPFENLPQTTLKRYNMFLRWMVRQDALDIGLWRKIHTKDLLIPLDTHTHKVSLKLNLIKRKSYDFKSVLELTDRLKEFDSNDPIKYDFALYRLGQSGEKLNWALKI